MKTNHGKCFTLSTAAALAELDSRHKHSSTAKVTTRTAFLPKMPRKLVAATKSLLPALVFCASGSVVLFRLMMFSKESIAVIILLLIIIVQKSELEFLSDAFKIDVDKTRLPPTAAARTNCKCSWKTENVQVVVSSECGSDTSAYV